jgi:hypothetical protein
VTSVATGTGLTGGPITGTGTIAVANSTANTLSGYNASGVFSGVAIGANLSLAAGTLSALGSGGSGTGLTATATKTANFSFVAGNLCPVDTTSGAITGALPTAPADGTVCAFKTIIQGGTNGMTVTAGGSDVINLAGVTSITYPYVMQERWYQYQASTSTWWTIAADDGTRNTGDYVSSSVASTTTSLTTGTYASPTSISLPAGDWDLSGTVSFNATTATITGVVGACSSSPTTSTLTDAAFNLDPLNSAQTIIMQFATPISRVQPTTTTTYYLVARSSFTAGSITAGGTIRARRWR